MEFVNREAECSNTSDSSNCYSSNDEDNNVLSDFITDDHDQEESLDFYRGAQHIFENHVRPIEDCDDPQPYLYSGDLMDANIHSFSDDKFRAEELKKSLLCFPAEKLEELNLFFSAVVFGIYYLNAKESPAPDLLTAFRAINPDKFSELRKIKHHIMLDYTAFVYLDKCMLLNDVLVRHFGCFLRLYERQNKYRYQIRKKLKSKNEIAAEISTCAQQKV